LRKPGVLEEPPSSGSKSNPSKKSEEAHNKIEKRYVPLKCGAVSKVHSITTQKAVLLIVTTMRTSSPAYINQWLRERCLLNICLLHQNIF
jgi:hypothetical protein